MEKEAKHIVSKNNTYVSVGMLLLIIGCVIFITKISFSLEVQGHETDKLERKIEKIEDRYVPRDEIDSKFSKVEKNLDEIKSRLDYVIEKLIEDKR